MRTFTSSFFFNQVVKKFCCLELLAKEYMEMSLKSVEDEISLAIPRGGVTLKSGWKIIPLHSPVVSY